MFKSKSILKDDSNCDKKDLLYTRYQYHQDYHDFSFGMYRNHDKMNGANILEWSTFIRNRAEVILALRYNIQMRQSIGVYATCVSFTDMVIP